METNNGSTEAVSIENESSREDSSTEKIRDIKIKPQHNDRGYDWEEYLTV